MACETRIRPQQTAEERAQEVREAIERLQIALGTGRVSVVIDPVTGALTFAGWGTAERSDVTDACVYDLAIKTGNTALLSAIEIAEQLAGRPVSKQAVATGIHSHDGGATWHKH